VSQTQADALTLFVTRLASRSVLTDNEKVALLSLDGKLERVAAHTDIVRPGDQVSHSCLVADGLLARFGQNADGERQITCLYIPGDMPDLASVVSPRAGWGLVALTATTILRVPHHALGRVAAEHPGIAEAFWRDCVADGAIFSEWVVNVGRRDSVSRLAHLLCEMAIRAEKAGQGDRRSFPLPITQADLGDATGLTAVHVNRTLKELRLQSLVEHRRGTVTIHDWGRLVDTGDFDPAFMLLDGPAPRNASTT
jgi:CRP-like cAMP-binding protein